MGEGKGPESPGSGTALEGNGAAMAPGREGLGAGAVEQAASVPTISAVDTRRRSVNVMGLILLEALLALVVFVAIVWWTMFAGRKRGELKPPPGGDDGQPPPAP